MSLGEIRKEIQKLKVNENDLASVKKE